MAKIFKCTCEHEGQDQMYGKFNRVFNEMETTGKFRCTVCGKEIKI